MTSNSSFPIPKSDWQWFGAPAHLCVARNCQFHLATKIGPYLVSTIGEYIPDAPIREIMAKYRGIQLTGRGDERLTSWLDQIGFEEIGCGRTYETMVFRAAHPCSCGCGLPTHTGSGLAMEGYNDAHAAQLGHLRLCKAAAFGELEASSND